MSVTKQQVIQFLDADEVDYTRAALLGEEALEFLAELITEEDELLASKAAYLASMIDAPQRDEVLKRASESRHATVRIAAAVGSNILPSKVAEPMIGNLLQDPDPGVRKQAILSATRISGSSEIGRTLRGIVSKDPVRELRISAQHSLGDGPALSD